MSAAHPVVVITGASAGVGRATARRFAGDGAAVALLSRNAARLDAAAADIRATGAQALTIVVDVADAEAVERAAERVEAELGPIDVWVNNAMVSVFSPVAELRADEVRRVTEVTYLGCVHGTLSALRRMRPRDSGTIVQVGSALAYRSIPLQAAYCAAKHAVVGFSDSLRVELLHEGSGVRVTNVHLPALNTPQFEWVRSRLPRRPQPVPPIFQPEVAATAIVWAARHAPRQVTVAYPTVGAVFGQRLFPGLLDRYLARSGFDSQQTDEPAEAGRADNLFGTVDGEYAAHGRFDQQAKARSWLLHLRMSVGRLGAALRR